MRAERDEDDKLTVKFIAPPKTEAESDIETKSTSEPETREHVTWPPIESRGDLLRRLGASGASSALGD
jgi:hypothetical protein